MSKNEYVTRQTLLRRASDPRDEKAWDEFVGYYGDFISALLYRMKVPASDQSDLTQNILMRLWKSLGKYVAQRTGFRVWLSAVIRNEVRSFFTRVQQPRNQQTELHDNLEALYFDDSAFEKMVSHEWATYVANLAMERVRKRFSGNAIEVFSLTLDGLDAETIAQQLGMDVFSVYGLRRRIRSYLREEIGYVRNELEQ